MKTTLELISECLPTLDEAISRSKLIEGGTLDGRDATRLGMFVPEERLYEIGLTVAEGQTHTPIEWNTENVASQLASDVDFAFTKALNKRGISASLMHDVLQMWQRILVPDLDLPDYPQYGLPVIKAIALRFNLPNRIGDDRGDEQQYKSD